MDTELTPEMRRSVSIGIGLLAGSVGEMGTAKSFHDLFMSYLEDGEPGYVVVQGVSNLARILLLAFAEEVGKDPHDVLQAIASTYGEQ